MKYTHEVEVEAESEEEAKQESIDLCDENNRMYDDEWEDSEII